MANNTIKTFTIQVDTKSGELKINGITKSVKEAQIEFDKLNKIAAKTAGAKGGVNKFADATGLAGAAVTELGRGITDLNYGFPAVANNITQLGSLFTILIGRTGNLTNALKLMWQTLKGPLGVLIAFQAVVTIIEAFSKKAKQADKTIKNLTNSFSAQLVELKSFVKILDSSNVSLEKKKKIVKELNEAHKDLNIQLDEEGDLTMDAQQSTLLYIEALKKKALAQAVIIQIQSNYQKQLEIENQEISDQVGFIDMITTSFLNFGKVSSTMSDLVVVGLENQEESISDLNASNDKLIEKLEKLGIIPEVNIKKEEKALKLKKGFVAKELSFADDILKSEENVTKKTIHGKEQQLKAESQYQIDLAQIKFKEYKRREEARVAAIKDPEDRLKAEKKADEAIKDSQESLSLFMLQKMKETNQLIDIERINDLQKASLRQTDFMNKEAEALLSFNAQMSTNELDRIAVEKLLNDEQHQNKLDKIDEEIAARKLANKSYVDLEEKQTNEINGYERQKTKFKEKEEKTKLAIANQVGEAIIGIAGEGSAVGKAVAVAMAIMNTKEAITAALGAKPYGPWNIAQAVAVGAFGMKQVQEIMSTKLPVEAAGGGAGAGASMSVSAPDFNVIGQGAGSQLAGVVGSRFGEPIKAYVLSSDVSSAQELDRRIDSTATIG
jgi:hypothetical protein